MASNTKIEWTMSQGPDGLWHPGYTFNPWIGCAKVAEGCANCLDPSSLVLMANWRTKPLGLIVPGDEVLAFPEIMTGCLSFRKAVVRRKWKSVKQAVRITTPAGSVIASLDHRFLTSLYQKPWRFVRRMRLLETQLRHLGDWAVPDEPASDDYARGYIAGMTAGDGTMSWQDQWLSLPWREHRQPYWRVAVTDKQRDMLEYLRSCLERFDISCVGGIQPFDASHGSAMLKLETRSKPKLASLKSLMEPDPESGDYIAGWLAGIFDAEGTSGYKTDGRVSGRLQSLRIANTNGKILQTIVDYGERLGFDFRIEQFSRYCQTARLYGGLGDRLRFISRVQPRIGYKRDQVLGKEPPQKPVPVTGLEMLGERELLDIETSEGTFFANGFFSHNCYAEHLMDTRRHRVQWGPQGTRSRTKTWNQPPRWNRQVQREGRRGKVFCASLADVFEERAELVPWRQDLFQLIDQCPDLDWLLLTKRPENIRDMWPDQRRRENVWLGTSVANQKNVAGHYIHSLRGCGRLCRRLFLSVEPQIGYINLSQHLGDGALEWVICGGESQQGPEMPREFHMEWARSLRDQCQMAGVAFFLKQCGSNPYLGGLPLPLCDHHGGDMTEWPEDLRVRQCPEVLERECVA
jgi:protein gp37